MRGIVWFVLCLAGISAEAKVLNQSLKADNSSFEPAEDSLKDILINLENELKNGVKAALKLIMPTILETMESLNLSSQCKRNGLQFIDGLRQLKPWAVRLVDSSGKIINGLLTGTASAIGVFDECIETVARSSRPRDKGKVLFTGQYCLVEFQIKMPRPKRPYLINEVMEEVKDLSSEDRIAGQLAMFAHVLYYNNLNLGVCVPSGCTVKDIRQIADVLGKKMKVHTQVERCQVKRGHSFSNGEIVVMTIYCFFGFLVLISTCVDTYFRYSNVSVKSMNIRLLLAFSLLINFKKFFNTKAQESRFSCLYGIRNISLFWIVLAHSYLALYPGTVQSTTKVSDRFKEPSLQIILNGSFAVETFFFMGGLLVSYWTVIHVTIKKQKFNVIQYILLRLWRILPAYYIVYIFTLFKDITTGPLYYSTYKRFASACDSHWWQSFFLINNFYNFKDMCFPHGWYIAVDFQLYVASLVILIPLLKWPKVGIFLGSLAILLSITYSVAVVYLNKLTGLILASPDYDFTDAVQTLYINPISHVTPYALSIIIGYFLATKKDIRIPRAVQVIGWVLALTFSSIVVFSTQRWNKGVYPSILENILTAATYRLAFTLAVAWVIICCSTGHGGIVNYLLSLKMWIPMARLNFLVYLIHPLVMFAYYASLKSLVQFDQFLVVWMFGGHLLISFMIAFVVNMVIEAPFLSMQKIVLGKKENQVSHDKSNHLNINSQNKSEENSDVIASNNAELATYKTKPIGKAI